MNVTAYRLRALREQKGWSQREVAQRIGITRAAYNKYEKYERGTSRPVRKLHELTVIFGVSADYLLGKDETAWETELVSIPDHNPLLFSKKNSLAASKAVFVFVFF
ncbi:MAG: helix-turn-helix transcriptional regulator [Selenomonadaceae bacterium]|nr:helix-turn-helix transcriptional regulator [Selenomonadaceae bacterium]